MLHTGEGDRSLSAHFVQVKGTVRERMCLCMYATDPPKPCSPPVLLWTYCRFYSRTDRTAELSASGSVFRSVVIHLYRRLTEPDCRFLPTDKKSASLPASVPFCPPLCSPPVLLWTYSRFYSRTDRTAELSASGSVFRSVVVHFYRRLTEPDCRFLPTDNKSASLYSFCFLVVLALGNGLYGMNITGKVISRGSIRGQRNG